MHADSGPIHIFVSHSHEDDAWCREFVRALRAAGADVWYDEHNLGYGTLGDVIEAELRKRPVFIVILSRPAVASRWVQREVDAAIRLQDQHHERVILPVMAEKSDVPIFWGGYKRISGPGDTALAPDEAARRVARVLGIGIAANPPAPAVTLAPAVASAPAVPPPAVARHAAPGAPSLSAKLVQRKPRARAITDVYDPDRRSMLVRYPIWFLILLVGTGFLALLLVGFFGYFDSLEGDATFKAFFTPWPLYLWFCALIVMLQYSVLRHPSLRSTWVMTCLVTACAIVFVGVIYLPVDARIGIPNSFAANSAIAYSLANPLVFLEVYFPALVAHFDGFTHLPLPFTVVAVGIWLLPGLIYLTDVKPALYASSNRVADDGARVSQATYSQLGTAGFVAVLKLVARIFYPMLTFFGVFSAGLAAGGIQFYVHILSYGITCKMGSQWNATLCGGQDTVRAVQKSLTDYQQYKAASFALVFGCCAILAIVFSLALLLFRRQVASNSLQFVLVVFVRVFAYWWFVSLALSAVNGLASLTGLSNRAPFPQPDPIAVISFAYFVVLLIVRRVRSSQQPAGPVYGASLDRSPN